MRRKKEFYGISDDISTVMIRGISVAIVFFVMVILVLASMFMFNTKGEFVMAFNGEIGLSPSFYVSAVIVMLVSSLLFTPFSFGISNYFINSKKDCARFSQIFYLFTDAPLMFKAIAMNSLTRLLIGILRIGVLLLAVVGECGLFVVSVVISGENIFDYEQNFLESVADFATHNTFFITVTVIEWSVVLALFLVIRIRYIMCKYALIRYPALGIAEAVRVGVFTIRGRIFKTVLFYLKYISIYIFTFLTMGASRTLLKNSGNESFSSYAVREIENGIDAYYLRRRC